MCIVKAQLKKGTILGTEFEIIFVIFQQNMWLITAHVLRTCLKPILKVIIINQPTKNSGVVVVHSFNSSTREVEAGGSLSLWSAWSTAGVQDNQGYTEKLCLKNKNKWDIS